MAKPPPPNPTMVALHDTLDAALDQALAMACHDSTEDYARVSACTAVADLALAKIRLCERGVWPAPKAAAPEETAQDVNPG